MATSEDRESPPDPVPATVREAGEEAVRGFSGFFSEKLTHPSTRTAYATEVRRFFRWAEERGLPLGGIECDHVTAYLRGLSSRPRRVLATTALRGLFSHLVTAE